MDMSMAHIRLLGGGLRDGRLKWYGIGYSKIELASIREHKEVAVDSSTVEAK